MEQRKRLPELLSPAGNFEKMKAALLYGADAVYLAGTRFGMRSAADNFTDEELLAAVEYAHARGKKVYLTMNTLPHSEEYPAIRDFLDRIKEFGIDAMIVADLGVLATIRELIPNMEIHISTQAGIVSAESAKAFAALGAKRLVLARELTLEQIRAIRRELPEEIELETFVHGSMCVSFSGRCMLSQNLTGRDANRGACTQPCRWTYTVVEEKRPNEPYPIEQNDLGTFIMSSKDMCMLRHVPALIEAGVTSFKIEGRMKSAYYTAVVTNAYRMAIDAYLQDPANYVFDEAWYREVESVSHRAYATGFWFDDPKKEPQLCTENGYIREKAYFATVVERGNAPAELEAENERGVLCRLRQRNKLSLGDKAELLTPSRVGIPLIVEELYDAEGAPIESAPHPLMEFYTRLPREAQAGDILRAGE